MGARTDEIVGRRAERARLASAWARARVGHGGIVCIEGEPGLGKSTLVADAVRGVASGDGRSVSGRAWDGNAPPWLPIAPCARALGVELPSTADAGSVFRVADELLAAFASSSQPWLVVVEDAHWADAQTLELLAFLAAPMKSLRVLFLVTTRPAPDVKSLSRLTRASDVIRLTQMPEEDVRALVARTSAQSGYSVTEEDARLLAARAHGVPLFAVELARAPLPPGASTASTPPSIVAIVEDRLAKMPVHCRSVLLDAAVLDGHPTAAVLGAMSGELPALVIDHVAPAIRAGVLVELAPGRFAFRHALVRDAVRAAADAKSAAAAHARAASALTGPDQAIERAFHIVASFSGDDAAWAAINAALDELEASGAFDRAHRLLAKVIDAERSLRGATVPSRLLTRASRNALGAGEAGAARTFATSAVAQARREGDVVALGDAALALGGQLLPGHIDLELVRLLDEAERGLAAAPRDEAIDAMHVRVRARHAAARQPAPDIREPITAALAAVEAARAVKDPRVLVEVLDHAGSAMTSLASADEVEAIAREGYDVALSVPDDIRALRSGLRLAIAQIQRGSFMAAEPIVEALALHAERVGHPRHVARVRLLLSMRATARGDFEESDRQIDGLRRYADAADDVVLRSNIEAHASMRPVALLDEPAARWLAANVGRFVSTMASGRAIAAMITGHVGAALRDPALAEIGASVFNAESVQQLGDIYTLAAAGEMHAVAGTMESRAALLSRLASHHDDDAASATVMAYLGPVIRIVGLLEEAQGNLDIAHERMRAALARARANQLHVWFARAALDFARVEKARGGASGGVSAVLDEARESARRPGFEPLLRRLDLEGGGAQVAVAVAPVASPAVALAGPELVLRREGDVWLVALGDKSVRVAHARGFELLARLMERPSEEVHVLALVQADEADEGDAGEALDARAAQAYRRRLREVDEEIEDARKRGDLGGGGRAQREREMIQRELERGFGLHGARRVASAAERARVNVQRRLKVAIDKVAAHDAAIADALRRSVRTGTFCSFVR